MFFVTYISIFYKVFCIILLPYSNVCTCSVEVLLYTKGFPCWNQYYWQNNCRDYNIIIMYVLHLINSVCIHNNHKIRMWRLYMTLYIVYNIISTLNNDAMMNMKDNNREILQIKRLLVIPNWNYKNVSETRWMWMTFSYVPALLCKRRSKNRKWYLSQV